MMPDIHFRSVVLINLDWLLLEHSHAWSEADLCALNAIGRLSRKADRVICCHRRAVERLTSTYYPSHATRERRSRWQNTAFDQTAYARCDRHHEQRAAATARLEPLVETLTRIGYPCVVAPGYSADDIIATLVLALEPVTEEVRIASDNPRLDLLLNARVRIEMLDPPSVDAFLERQDRLRSANCERSQLRDWHVLERSLRGLFRTRRALQDEVGRILRHHRSLIELDARLRANPQDVAEFFAARPDVLAHLIRNRTNLEAAMNEWGLDKNAPIDVAEALEAAPVQAPTEAEAALLAGTPWRPPLPEQNFDEVPLASFPDVEAQLRRRGVTERGRIQFIPFVIDHRPALVVDRGEPVQLKLDQPSSLCSAARLFSSAAARDRHLEHLWRYADLASR